MVRTRGIWAVMLPLCTAAFLAACDDDGSGPAPLEACTGPVTISVSAGTTPLFRWTPACRVNYLVVEEAGLAGDVWAVVTDSTNQISPGVRYATVPPGAREHEDPEPLLVGQAYEVAVGRWTGSGPFGIEVLGVQTFTP